MKRFNLDFLPAVDPELVSALDQELALRARQTSLTLAFVCLLAAHITGLLTSHPALVLPALAVISLLGVLRMVLSVRFETLYNRSPRAWLAAFCACSLVPALIVGLGMGALAVDQGAGWNTVVCLGIATAMTSGASISFTPRLPLFYGYTILYLLPSVLAMVTLHRASAAWLAAMTVFFMGQIIVFGRFNHNTLRDKLRNHRLLEIRAAQLEKASAVAQAADSAKGDFLANMSHELKTPLNGILGLTDLLFDTPLQERQSKYLQDVRNLGQNLLQTITSVLDYSRVEKGDWTLHPSQFSLSELLRRVHATGEQAARAGGNQLILDLDRDLPASLVGDAPAIGQITTRLLENAARFTRDGQITLSGRVHHRNGGLAAVSIAVQDTGPGIPADRHDLIFQAFNKTDRASGNQSGGTGLGLAMARRMAQHMGGRLHLESAPGQGSTFTLLLTLPEARPEAEQASSGGVAGTTSNPVKAIPSQDENRTDQEESLEGLRVLLAEDNTVNAKLTTRILEKYLVQVTWAHNGKEAVNHFLQEEFDLVLMDIQMPVMDGFTATNALREAERDRGGRVPIIALTAHAMPGYREKCLIGGMDDYLTKPLQPAALRRMLANWSPARQTARQT